MSIIDQHIGKRLAQAREQSGKRSEDAAAVLGIGVLAYSQMEKGDSRIDALTLAKLSRFYRQPISWFYAGLPGQAAFDKSRSSR